MWWAECFWHVHIEALVKAEQCQRETRKMEAHDCFILYNPNSLKKQKALFFFPARINLKQTWLHLQEKLPILLPRPDGPPGGWVQGLAVAARPHPSGRGSSLSGC